MSADCFGGIQDGQCQQGFSAFESAGRANRYREVGFEEIIVISPKPVSGIVSGSPTSRIRFHPYHVILLLMEMGTCRSLVRAIVALGITIGTALAARAADPIVGTWKLDVSKSKLVASLSPPKAQTEVYRELASGQIELELTRVNNEGASTSVIFSWPAGGGVVQVLEMACPKA